MAAGVPHPFLFSTVFNMDYLTIGGESVKFTYVFFAWVGMILLTLIGLYVKKNVSLVPGKIQSIFEAFIDGLETFILDSIGEKGQKYVSLLVGIFIYIFTMNILGLIPGFDAPTASLNTTVAVALFVFLYYNYVGIKTHGFHYIQHFTGTNKALMPLMFPIEVISNLARPLSMSLRLFGNIFAEEMTLIIFFGFGTSISIAVLFGTIPMYFLFLLGKTLQAFILFILAMIYIKGSLEHAH